MKKLLLSIFLPSAFGLANAQTELNVNDATDIKGTLVEETYNDKGAVSAAKHYQPLESFVLGGYSFSFSSSEKTKPAYYYATSTSTNQQCTVRIYNGTTMSITAPADENMVKIEFTGSNVGDGLTFDCNNGSVTLDGSNATWTGSTAELSVTVNASYRISKLVITTGDGGDVPVVEKPVFVKATEIVDGGEYVMVVDGKVCTPVSQSYNYGRLSLGEVTIENDELTTDEKNVIVINGVGAEGKYTLTDVYGRYLAMDDSHFTSFQLYTEVNDGCYWTASTVEGEFAFYNVLNTDCVICQSMGAQGAFYTNVAPAKAPEEYNLPVLYVKKSSGGVSAVAIDNSENAPVEYYNLQGVRVVNPENGLYIRRQGNTVTKILVK